MIDRFIFRGKRLDKDKWATGNLIQIQRDLYTEFMVNGDLIISDTLGQCTGLKDVNEKLIFDGDVIDFIEFDSGRGCGTQQRGVVKFGIYEWEIWILNDSVKGFTLGFIYENDDTLEIIGNVVDNPELLT